MKKQELDKATHEEQQAALQIEKIGAGETFTPEEREWDEITLPPINTQLKKFVICMDTMGQDREFTKQEKVFAIQSIYRFKKYWEDFENEKLIADRDSLVAEKVEDEDKFTEEIVLGFKEKEDNMVENKINPPPPEEPKEKAEDEEEPEPIDYEQRAIEITEMKLKF